MNRLNFNQSGGFPLETEILDEMQKAAAILNYLGDIVGNFGIISGCNVVGSNVTDGCVFINGEVLFFKGGPTQTTVIIKEDIQQREFEDANTHDVIFTRYACFGIGVGSYNWADFKRPKTTVQLTEQKAEQSLIETLIERIETLEARPLANVPVGLVALWDDIAFLIPEGWVEHIPLRGRTAIGHDASQVEFDVVGKTGGSKTHTLTVPQLPPHRHATDSQGGVTGGERAEPWEGVGGAGNQTGSTGEGQAFPILNPFRVVHFIKYVG